MVPNKIKESAKVAVFNPHGEILTLVKSPFDSDRPNGWDWPGGKLKKHESPIEAARRETQEETGLVLGALFKIGTYEGFNREGRPEKTHQFGAHLSEFPGELRLNLAEHIHSLWLPPIDFIRLPLLPQKFHIEIESIAVPVTRYPHQAVQFEVVT